ncbi:MAG: hypothetical protein BWK76_26020 [Desulfobulbaceae bacterium A2]|nr:MAG: hypothetical protein BWK76_26020 [Desulfobulbaceae bacterium A2]
MKAWKTLVLTCGCSLLLGHCASQDEISRLEYQLRAVNRKVDEVQNTTADQLQKRQANASSRLEETQGEVQQLRALLDENMQLNSQLRERYKQLESSVQTTVKTGVETHEARIKHLEERQETLAKELDQLRQGRAREAELRAKEASAKADEALRKASAVAGGTVQADKRKTKPETTGKTLTTGPTAAAAPTATLATAPAPAAAAPAPTAAAAPAPAAADLYSQGKAKYSAGQYREAYSVLERHLGSNPSSDSQAETLFLMGESQFQQKEYDLAILDYQKVVTGHARHGRAPDALLKQAMAFEKLTDNETAKILYKKLLEEYKNTPQAEAAKQRLEKM